MVSDVEALLEIAEDSGGAIPSFRAGDADSLSGLLRGLLRDPALRKSLARQGREWVHEHRSWHAVARAYVPVYEQLAVPRVAGERIRVG